MTIEIPKLAHFSVLALMVGTLGACDSARTDIVERDPVINKPGGHGSGDAHSDERGRLLVSAADTAQVSVLDLDDYEVLAQYETMGIPTALYASPGYRYGFIVQRDADRVGAVDGGLWAEEHGDHMDFYSEMPQWMSFSAEASRPSHFAGTSSQTAIFYDGHSSTAVPARVGVFTEASVTNGSDGQWLDYETHMHGAAQARGDYLLSTLRDPMSESTLPDQVALYHWHDDHFEQEQIFEESCPGQHGSAQAHEFIVFGCTDGVLVIEQQGSDFVASKIANPESFVSSDPEVASLRVGTLVAHDHHEFFVGIAGGQFFEVDPAASTILPIEWTDEEVSAVRYAFADGGELFVILDDQGKLHILSVHSNWSVLATVQVLNAALDGEGNPVPFDRNTTDLVASAASHEVFVLDAVEDRIQIVDVDHGEVSDSIPLDFTPLRLTWLGVASVDGDHHEEH